MNRRQFITAAGCLVGGALIAETVVLRRRTAEFKSTMTTLFWVGEPSDAEIPLSLMMSATGIRTGSSLWRR